MVSGDVGQPFDDILGVAVFPSNSFWGKSTKGVVRVEMIMGVPKSYRSLKEFEREELGRDKQAGFSIDDLIHEATFGASDMLFDDTFDEYDPSELEED